MCFIVLLKVDVFVNIYVQKNIIGDFIDFPVGNEVCCSAKKYLRRHLVHETTCVQTCFLGIYVVGSGDFYSINAAEVKEFASNKQQVAGTNSANLP